MKFLSFQYDLNLHFVMIFTISFDFFKILILKHSFNSSQIFNQNYQIY